MSTYADMPSRLANEKYASPRIPERLDYDIAGFLNEVRAADRFAEISQDLNAAIGWILLAFADRAASYAVRVQNATWARHGIMAAQLATTQIDPREALVVYSILYRAIEILDGNPIDVFREVAGQATAEIGDFTVSFALGDTEDKSIAAMGYVEDADEDGFVFRRTW